MRFACIIFFIFLSSSLSFCQQFTVDSLVQTLSNYPKADSNRVTQLVIVADELTNLGEYQNAFFKLEEAYKISERINFPRGLAKAKLYEGLVYYRKDEIHNTFIPLRSALSNFQLANDNTGLALTHHWLGNCYYFINEYNTALENYLKSYAIREKQKDKRGMAFTLTNIGNVYNAQQDFERALEFHQRSIAIKEELDDERSLAFSYNNIGNIYMELKQYQEAMVFCNAALTIFEKIKYKQGIAYALGSLGAVYERQERYPTALQTLQKCVKLLIELGDNKALAEAYNHIGNVQRSLRMYDDAFKSLSNAREYAISSDTPAELVKNYWHLAKLDSSRGNMTAAFNWMNNYTMLKEQLFTREKSMQIAQLQATYDAERKDRTIEMLAQERDIQESRRITQRLFFASGLSLLAIVSIGLIYFLRQKSKTNKILKAQKEHSEQLNRMKDKLFSIIAHDLRSPLHSLKGLLTLASQHNITETELKMLLGTIDKNTESTMHLVDNLLMWAKENLTGSTIVPEKFNLQDVVEANIRLLSSQAKNKEIDISCDHSMSATVYADKNMIDLVIRNLLLNAIKFTNQGGKVELGLKTEKDGPVIFVKDNGVGIPEERLSTIFGTGNVSTTGTANEKGTGLGLILCKEFVEKNLGKIWVESTIGRGTTFNVLLPAG